MLAGWETSEAPDISPGSPNPLFLYQKPIAWKRLEYLIWHLMCSLISLSLRFPLVKQGQHWCLLVGLAGRIERARELKCLDFLAHFKCSTNATTFRAQGFVLVGASSRFHTFLNFWERTIERRKNFSVRDLSQCLLRLRIHPHSFW